MALTDRDYRLSSSSRIGELFDAGLSVSDARAVLLGLPNSEGHPRMAYAVGRPHGKAVRRNRVRRLCREAFRAVRGRMEGGWDLAIVPRARVAHTVADLSDCIESLFARLVRKAEKVGK